MTQRLETIVKSESRKCGLERGAALLPLPPPPCTSPRGEGRCTAGRCRSSSRRRSPGEYRARLSRIYRAQYKFTSTTVEIYAATGAPPPTAQTIFIGENGILFPRKHQMQNTSLQARVLSPSPPPSPSPKRKQRQSQSESVSPASRETSGKSKCKFVARPYRLAAFLSASPLT